MNHPRVSFVMPAYNVEKYIVEAVESVLAQTVPFHELIIIDDGSTDGTAEVLTPFLKDSRIRLVKSQKCSGGAYVPRRQAIMMASGEFIAPLDADDAVPRDYLERLLADIGRTGADIVYPTMCDFATGRHIAPTDESFYRKAFEGRECVKYTLETWRIGCNGGLIRRSVYLEAFEKYVPDVIHSQSDELLTRHLLLHARRVAFSPVPYLYRDNPDSITKRISFKLFDFLINDKDLLELIVREYGEDSSECLMARRQIFHGFFRAGFLLNTYSYSAREKNEVRRRIAEGADLMDWHRIRGQVSPRYYFLLKHFPVQFAAAVVDAGRTLLGKF